MTVHFNPFHKSSYGAIGYIMETSHIAEGKLMDKEFLNAWGAKSTETVEYKLA